MKLAIGESLGPYTILASIGKGGMGEVFKARDTRLNRDVAIKVSAERFTERFEREARVIASLNHPNICTLYDVGPNYLVMEFIEGESPKGPLPLETVLSYARQLADAFDCAHEKAITHRDLKPANLKITPDGVLKVLDFGLAKVGRTRTEAPSQDSPTLTMTMTEAGMILGTAAYMSPEQAKGKDVDKRADIWAYGVVLYEFATGKRLFRGDDVGDILASVLKDQPDYELVPEQLRPLLQRCLEKDPKRRLRDIADAMALTAVQTKAPAVARRSHYAWFAATALAVALGVALWAPWRTASFPEQTLRFTIPPPEGAVIDTLAISGDGKSLAVAATRGGKRMLWLRSMDSLEYKEMQGTEGAQYPFWSPDGRSVGFFAERKLKRVSTNGGPVQTLTNGNAVGGGTWRRDGKILFQFNAIANVSELGGKAGVELPMVQGRVPFFPYWLPDEQRFLYSVLLGPPEQQGIYATRSGEGNGRRILPDPSPGLYLPSTFGGGKDQILFVRDGVLMAQAVDPRTLDLSEDALAIAPVNYLRGQFSISRSGTLAYVAGRGGSQPNTQLRWFDRKGVEMSTIMSDNGSIVGFDLSPDDRQVAIEHAAGDSSDLWIYDLQRNTESRFTSDPAKDSDPVWSPDRASIFFSSQRAGRTDLYRKMTNGSPESKYMPAGITPNGALRPLDWSRDGRFLLFRGAGIGGGNTFAVALDGGSSIAVTPATFQSLQTRLSPDGRWLAYTSDESGRLEVYVQPFPLSPRPSTSGRIPISSGGASTPVWSADGKELFYVAADGRLMSVAVRGSGGNELMLGAAEDLFRLPDLLERDRQNLSVRYDVSSDGKRFLVLMSPDDAEAPSISVIANWQPGVTK